MKMKDHGSPIHPGSSGDPGDTGDNNEEMMYEEVEVDFDDDDDMIEITDDFEIDGTDGGNLADDEEDEEFDYAGPGMEGFNGQQPDHILTHCANTNLEENSVFCCCFDTAGQRLLTGGQDDFANVWDSTSMKNQSPIFKCRGHKDSVTQVAFSFNSSYFSTCDLSGIVKVWKSANHENVLTFETSDLAWSQWHFGINVLFAGCNDGSIYMWKVPSGECKILTGSSTRCECGVVLPDGKRLMAGYADGTLKLFDLKSTEVQHNFTKSFTHPSQVFCVAAHPTRQVVASGSADGTVALLNSETGKLLATLQVCLPNVENISEEDDEETSERDSVEGLGFCPHSMFDYLVCGSISGNIVIWDLSTMMERVKIQQEAGISKIIWDPCAPLLYTAGLDGVVRLIDARTCKIEKLLGRHRTEILDICISKDGKKLASTSDDGTVFVYNMNKPPPSPILLSE